MLAQYLLLPQVKQAKIETGVLLDTPVIKCYLIYQKTSFLLMYDGKTKS